MEALPLPAALKLVSACCGKDLEETDKEALQVSQLSHAYKQPISTYFNLKLAEPMLRQSVFSFLPLLTRTRKPGFEQVIEICGRLPVALKVVAGMVACGQKWGQLLDDLQDGSEFEAFVVFVYPCRTSNAYTDSGAGIHTHAP